MAELQAQSIEYLAVADARLDDFTDLQNMFVPFALLLSLFTAAGCQTRVEVESSKWESSSHQSERTAVELDLLRSRPPEPVALPQATETQPQPLAAEEKSVFGSGNTLIIINYRGGDTHYETNIRIQEAAPQRIEEQATIHREVQVEPRRQVDERCELLRKQHEDRAEIWRRSPPSLHVSSVRRSPNANTDYCTGRPAVRFLLRSMDWRARYLSPNLAMLSSSSSYWL